MVRRFAENALPTAMILGNRKARLVQIRAMIADPKTGPLDCRPGASRDPCCLTNAVRHWIPGLAKVHREDASSPSFPRKREPSGVHGASATLPTTLDPRFRGDDAQHNRRSRESGNPAAFVERPQRFQRHWIPAFAGMTRLFPVAATLCVLLLDGCAAAFPLQPSFPRKRESIGSDETWIPAPDSIIRGQALRGDDAVVSSRGDALRLALGHPPPTPCNGARIAISRVVGLRRLAIPRRSPRYAWGPSSGTRNVTSSRSLPARTRSMTPASHPASGVQNRRLQPCLRSPSPGS
jgi:hypothetical protein